VVRIFNHGSFFLIRDGWDADDQGWNDAHGIIRLRWTIKKLTYDLQGSTQNIILEQLIDIALSTLEQIFESALLRRKIKSPRTRANAR